MLQRSFSLPKDEQEMGLILMSCAVSAEAVHQLS
jgi:hypothetical protein